MCARHYNILFVTALLLFSVSKAHSQRYNFQNYTTENGLANTAVLAITQLKNGEIWLGTNDGGINIYNGSEFKELNKSNGLADNVVYDLFIDSTDAIYISTNNGVSLYKKGQLDSIPNGDTLVHTRVFQSFIDSKGNHWLATARGLAQLRSGKIYHYPTQSEKLNNASCINITEDTEHNIWISTLGNDVFKLAGNGEVTSYAYGNETRYTFSTFHPEKGTVWFLSYKGLFVLQDETLTKKEFDSFKVYSSTYFQACLKDRKGTIWLGTSRGLLRVSNGHEKLFTEQNGLTNNDVWKIFEDREENIWITTKLNGVSKFNSELFELINTDFGLPDNYVQSVFVDSEGNNWAGTKNGIYCANDDTSFMLVREPNSRSANNIHDINEDSKGNMYFMSQSGLLRYYNGELKRYNIRSNDSIFKGYCVLIDNDEPLLGGILGLGRVKNDIIELVNDEFHFPNTPVHVIFKDNDGAYWFGTDEGLLKFENNSLTHIGKEHGVSDNKVRTIIKDSAGNLWIGSSDGIHIYKDGQFMHLTEKDGLTSNTIYSMVFDPQGALWVGHQNGVDKLNIIDFSIDSVRYYSAGRGFMANTCNNNAIAISKSGKVLVGTDHGILQYNKGFDHINEFETITEITDIKLFSQPTDWGKYCDSLDRKGFPVNPVLSFRENYFTFDFIGVSHKNPAAVKYKYRLQGFDQNWIEGIRKRNAVYSNLPFGSYNFQVASSNDEGIWNKIPVEFSFTITPPFWRTWWFYSLCALAALFVIVSYYQIRISNIKIKRRNDKINRQNNIIEEKNREIVDSINYAKRIQDAILPSNLIKNELPDSFVYFRPKDIVSGDFYWLKKVDGILLVAAVDCTGHGVPGGFVSMVGHSGLNRAVSEYRLKQPAAILDKLSELVTDTFDDGTKKGVKDGMDVAICSIDKNNLILNYSGANNPLYLIRKSDKPILSVDGKPIATKALDNLSEIKGNRRPVGFSDSKTDFTNHQIQLEKEDRVYIFTDGFPDQFGGQKGKKLMYKPFKQMLLSMETTPMDKQSDLLNTEFETWCGQLEQIDDICIIGFQV